MKKAEWKVRSWKQKWVLVPNVFQFGKEIWIKKWLTTDIVHV